MSQRVRHSLLGTSVVVALRTFDATRTARTLVLAVVAVPIIQVLYLAGLASTPRMIVVGATAGLLSGATAAVEAVTVAMTRMRYDAVLPTILLGSRSGSLVWLGAGLASALIGSLAGLVSLATAFALFDRDASHQAFLPAAVLVVCTAVGSGGCGFAIGAFGLRARDGLAGVAPFVGVMTVLGGVVAPVSELPPPFEALARLLPLGYASDALREVFGGGPAEELVPHFAAVLVVGAAWFALGHLAWTLARRSARRSGTADLI